MSALDDNYDHDLPTLNHLLNSDELPTQDLVQILDLALQASDVVIQSQQSLINSQIVELNENENVRRSQGNLIKVYEEKISQLRATVHKKEDIIGKMEHLNRDLRERLARVEKSHRDLRAILREEREISEEMSKKLAISMETEMTDDCLGAFGGLRKVREIAWKWT